jgi:hypothetical protein
VKRLAVLAVVAAACGSAETAGPSPSAPFPRPAERSSLAGRVPDAPRTSARLAPAQLEALPAVLAPPQAQDNDLAVLVPLEAAALIAELQQQVSDVIRQVLILPFTAVRFTISSLLLWLVLRMVEGPAPLPPGALKKLILLGVLGNTCYQLFFTVGLARTTATNSALTFLMQSNLVLEANFVTNPFIATKGVYNDQEFAEFDYIREKSAESQLAVAEVHQQELHARGQLRDAGIARRARARAR